MKNKNRFRGSAPLGSIKWAFEFGKINATLIRSIRTGGYKKAREYFDFYNDKRAAHGAALRAVNIINKIGNPRPFYIDRDGDSAMICALCFLETIKNRAPRYLPMRHLGKDKYSSHVEPMFHYRKWLKQTNI